MVGIDFRDHQGNVLLHAKGAGIGDDGAAGGGKLGLQLAGNAGIERGEDDLGRARRFGGGNRHFGHGFGNRSLETPARGFRVIKSGGALGGGQPCHLEPGVVLQQLNKPLADHTGSAKNANWNSG